MFRSCSGTVPVEPLADGDRACCPVWRVRTWIRKRPGGDGTSGIGLSLFVTEAGRSMTVAAISAVVKRMAATMGCKEPVSGHSLRIGGACAAAEAGLGIEAIRAVGGWVGDSVFRYVRASAVPALGAGGCWGVNLVKGWL